MANTSKFFMAPPVSSPFFQKPGSVHCKHTVANGFLPLVTQIVAKKVTNFDLQNKATPQSNPKTSPRFIS
jgi:hypothetical protein